MHVSIYNQKMCGVYFICYLYRHLSRTFTISYTGIGCLQQDEAGHFLSLGVHRVAHRDERIGGIPPGVLLLPVQIPVGRPDSWHEQHGCEQYERDGQTKASAVDFQLHVVIVAATGR